jgi:N-carbamoyl-L-amino-acid hydrolase
MTIELDYDRFVETMREQARIGATENGGLHRLALSDADREVRDWFVERMEAEDLDVRVDEFGNTFGRRAGADPDAAPVLVGSHLDSQPYGGIYDGPLGVVAALETVRTLNDQAVETRRAIEIVNWTNEEGSRYQPAMQGSGVWAGELDVEDEYDATDDQGIRLEDELERIGYKGERPAEPQEEYDTYLELHIEQGPRLEEAGADVGIVTGMVGFTWGCITFRGQANHSGTTPMRSRNDALVGAADVITAIRRLPGTLGERTVGTTGSLSVEPDSINVIPEEVRFTWDVRDPDDGTVATAVERVTAEAAAEREGLEFECEEFTRTRSVEFADRCVAAIEDAADALGYDGRHLVSGAGHDASHVASVCDAGMVFAVSEGGKSHTEEEYTSWEDCYTAATTLGNAAIELAEPMGDA